MTMVWSKFLKMKSVQKFYLTFGGAVVFNRGHGGYDSSTGSVLICSGERWNSSKYTYEQGQGWVVRAYISQGGVYYDFFAYFPGLIAHYYSNLPKSLIYMEPCEGIKNSSMADAWRGAGAGAYMSWTRSVLVVDGDATAEANIYDFCINDLSICQIVAKGYSSGGAKLSYKETATLGL